VEADRRPVPDVMVGPLNLVGPATVAEDPRQQSPTRQGCSEGTRGEPHEVKGREADADPADQEEASTPTPRYSPGHPEHDEVDENQSPEDHKRCRRSGSHGRPDRQPDEDGPDGERGYREQGRSAARVWGTSWSLLDGGARGHG